MRSRTGWAASPSAAWSTTKPSSVRPSIIDLARLASSSTSKICFPMPVPRPLGTIPGIIARNL
ncbi:hypothetical protein [Singulisphaera sp. PoT]|uniref:hypothetical protein n=1 Tax=Singulisphaera sp. PoT TaxID=3411797 RepID=UPI003BF4FA86